MKNIIILLLLLFTAACDSSATAGAFADPTTKVGTKENVNAMYELFRHTKGVGTPHGPDLGIRATLPKIHSWLTPGIGLKKVNIGGEVGYILRPIPKLILEEITSVTFSDEFKSGFLILQSSFWKMADEKMKSGLRIGFIDYDGMKGVNGVYFDTAQTILVGIISAPGTLIHESRHHEQYLAFHERKSSWSGTNTASNPQLSNKCVEGFSRFFAELDATTVELPSWVGVFQTINTHPLGDLSNSMFGDRDIALMGLLDTNLSYPETASDDWVQPVPQDQKCPDSILTAIATIIGKTDEFRLIATNEFAEINGAKALDHRAQMSSIGDHCTQPIAKPESNEKCLSYQKDIEYAQGKAKEAKDKLDELFRQAQSSREEAIQNALASIPSDLALELCDRAIGFSFHFNCLNTPRQK
jgi:hypothetical protein